MRRYFKAFYAVLLAFGPAACAMHGQSATPTALPPYNPQNIVRPFDTHGGIASEDVVLGDAAPVLGGKQLAHLNVAITEVDTTDSSGRTQVVAQYSTPLIVDLLQYQGGAGALVASSTGPQVGYQQLRLVLNVASSQAVYTDNSTDALIFAAGASSASTSGAGSSTATAFNAPGQVAITVNQSFAGPSTGQIFADFNLFESLATTTGGLLVQPAFFVAVTSNAGQVTGTILNRNGVPVANATVVAVGSAGNVGNTTSTDASGNFEMHALQSDTYQLQVYNKYTNAAGAQFFASNATNTRGSALPGPTITVTPGQSTNAGTITD